MKKDFQNKALFYRVFAVICLIIISQTVHAQVSGTVFRDFNSNGQIDTTASFKEIGQIGVIVKAFNASGAEVGTATTDKNGLYSISGVSGPLRVEFSNLPNLDFSSFSGGTSVQFVNGGATNINFGINFPNDYCQKDPLLSTTCYASEDAANSADKVFIKFPLSYTNDIDGNINGTAFGNPAQQGNVIYTPAPPKPSALASVGDIGSTWGIAWDKIGKKLYTSTHVKRGTRLGPTESTGVIWVTNNVAGGTTPTQYVDLNSIFGVNTTGLNPHPLASTNWKSNDWDGNSLPVIGKVGLGDMDISRDGKKIYVVNLADRKLYEIPTSGALDATTIKRYAIPTTGLPVILDASGTQGIANSIDIRPFGLGFDRNGDLYVGAVHSAESISSGADADPNAASYQMTAYVWKFINGVFTLVLNESLRFDRDGSGGYETNDIRTGPNANYLTDWEPWTNEDNLSNQQPLLTDIDFDGDKMVLGFRDRGGDQNYGPKSSGGFLSSGDIILACPNGNLFKFEQAGGCGGLQSSRGTNKQGPGGGEFYEDLQGDNIKNAGVGGIAILQGYGVLSTATDAVVQNSNGSFMPNFGAAGVQVYSQKNGDYKGGFDVYNGSAVPSFAKASGLGDLEVLCDVPPIQIGNRIWIDKDKDGIQDADEKPYPNIKVALYDSTGTKVSEVTTNALGEYYFDTLNIAGGKLLPLSRYEIRIAKTAINDTLRLTESNTGTSDLIDSDADLVGTDYAIPVLTGNYGENNHSYDFGFTPELPDLKVTKTSNKSIVKKGQNVKFTVTIKNEGKGKATSIKLEDLIPSGATLVNSTTTSTTSTNAGAYNAGIWSIDSLVAKDSVILVIEVTANQEGVVSNVAQIKSMNEKDVDSTPGNSNYKEDDIATACYTVPYEFCKADKPTFTLSAPDSLTTVKWFKNGVELTAEAGKKNITVSDSGSYYYQGITPTTLCNAGSCCPIILDPSKVGNAGKDTTVCASDGIFQLKAAPAGTSWSSATNNPSPATIGTSTGLISGMVLAGNYQFIIKGDTCCADTVKITKIDCFGSIGDYVWFDKNQNGLQDIGEVPVKGIKVILYGADGTTKLDSTLTDASGKYLFSKLKTNDYYVKFVAPKDSALTGNLSGSNRAIDSNADPLTGLSDRVSINTALPAGDPGRDNRDVDAGLIPRYGSIGDFVWYDKNGDGKQDLTELPVKGIKVILYKENSLGVFVKVDSTITNNVVGNYLFDSLGTGNYKVRFVVPKDSAITIQNSGSNTAIDSNADPLTGFTGVIGIDVSKPSGDIGRDNRSIDAGIIPAYGSIGDYVWTDQNSDGQQTAGELPIQGVKVYLYNAAGTVKLDSTVTDSNGKYLFDSLLTGSYKVKFVAPAGTIPAKSNTGVDVSDSDANKLGFSQVININTALSPTDTLRNNPQIDAGFVPVGSIGDYVFVDKNGDGIQNAGDTPIAGIKVYLLDNAGVKLDSTITDANGKYLFDSLLANTYKVKFVIPAGSEATGKTLGGDPTKDSNINPDGTTDAVIIDTTLPLGNIGRNNPTIDAGIKPAYGSIGDYVWTDQNNDGQQTAGELPISGVKVYLYNAAGTVKLDSTVTDVNGKYLFDSLLTGGYKVKFVAPAGTIPAKQNVGNDVSDSDANKLGFSQVININTALLATDTLRNNPQIDAGFVPVGSIGDYVFTDKNADGIQNAGDTPIAGIKVYLLDNAGVKLDSTITDVNGKYLFDSLLANTYKVKFVIPVGSEATGKTLGGDPTKDSNINPDGTTDAVIIDTTLPLGNVGRNNPTIDAGIKPAYGSIGDYVWTDKNNDGQQTAGELPIQGVKVYLYNAAGTVKLDSTLTDVNGKYLFDSLLTGSYKVKFVAPAGTIPAKSNVGNDVSDSDANKLGFSQVININTALSPTDTLRNNPQIDAGFVPVGSLGDYVFVDKNGDGIQNAGDTPIAGIKVYLLDNAGVKLDSTTTDVNGKFLFDSLLANTYKVKFVIPAGSEATGKTLGGDPTKDSNINPDGTTDAVIIDTNLPLGNIGRNNPTIDAGIKPAYGSIGDYVWFDQNNDGQQTAGELPIQGVKVFLYNAAGTVKLDSTVTDVNGKYLFDSLLTGSYKVKFVAPAGTIPAKQNVGSDVSDSDANKLGFSQVININTALSPTDTLRNNPQIDAGFVPVGSIGDYVFVDKNGDGIQNAGDTPIAGIKVYLLDNAGVKIDSMVTDVNGIYLFDSLLANTYKVKFVIPAGSEATGKTLGGDPTKDSNINPDGTTDAVIIDTTLPLGNIGRNNPTIDAGIKPAYGSIGDYVWTDQNNDGQQTAGEVPIQGVKVYLYNAAGTVKLDSTVTDVNGKYLFDSLLTGSYKVKFVAPAGTIPAKSNVGNDVSDSDANKLGFSQVININTALLATDTLRNNPQIDAGFVPVGSIGDYVFNDKDGNNIQSAGDTPVAGVKVYLLNSLGAKIDSTVTDASGKYLFDSLLAGTYKVQFVAPVGTNIVPKGTGTATDSDANPSTGITDNVLIDTTLPLGNIGRNNPTIDAGIKGIPQYGSIGDYVWTDTNNDGQQAGESPIQGVKVILYAGDGVTKLDSTVTDVNGKYLFDNLLTGSYKVKFVAQAGTIPAKQNIGNDVSDSDANKLGFSQVININTALSPTDTLRNNPQIDAGFVPVGSIGDYVFLDKDNSNTQTAGDTPVAGVKVYLLDNTGNKIDSTTTDATGKYLFSNVPSGTYSVQFVAPVGSSFVTPNSGDDNLDSDAGVNGKTSQITIDATQLIGTPARDNRSVDAGIKPPAIPYGSIGDYVWFDANKDGLQTSGEAPVKGVKVYLVNSTGAIIDSTKTDVNGKYLFDSLITGSYKIKFIAPKDSNLTVKGTNPLSAIDSNPDTTTGLTDAISIDTSKPAGDPGRDNRDVDAGITVNLGSIAGKTFDDNDKSGTQNTGDVDRPAVKVYLYKEISGVYVKVDSVITDSQGNYKFNNLTTANYQVQFSKPTGTTFTNSNIGNDTLDSDASLTDGKTGIISINTNLPETDLGRNSKYNDAGFIPVPVDCKTDICVPYVIKKVLK